MTDQTNERIAVELTASVNGLLAGMKQGAAAVEQATAQMTGSLGGISKAFESLKAPFVAFTALLAGGAMFKEAITATVDWNLESIKLARTLGITTEQASVLAVALDDIFVSTETYLHASQMMTRQLNSGGEAFKKLGVETRDSGGQLRSTADLMTDVLGKLNDLKQGTDRNAAGLSIFGRSWGEAQKLLVLTSEKMSDAREKAERLNLIVGGDSVEATKKYREAMQDVDDVFLALKLAIGKELMPLLTGLAEWFGQNGATAVKIFGGVLQTLITTIDILLTPLRLLASLMVAVAHAMNGDFAAAKEALKEMAGDADILGRLMDRMKPKPVSKGTRFGSEGTGDANTGPAKDESEKLVQAWSLELEKLKAIESNWFTWDTVQELDFWSRKYDMTAAGTKAQLAVLTMVNKLRKELGKEAIEADVEFGKYEMTLNADNLAEKLRWAKAIVEVQRHAYGEGSKQSIAALREVETVEKEIRDKQKKQAFDAFSPLTDAWHSSLASMLSGAQTFGESVGNIWKGLGQVVDKAISSMADEWIGSHAKQLAIFLTTKARELLVHLGINTAKTASTATAASAQVASEAAVAGAGAAASAATVPGIGWLIAIPAALAVVAGVMALRSNIASAAGGWGTVPSDQVAQLHKNEMVLPASIAEPLRRATAGGEIGGGGDTFTVNIHAVDAASFSAMLSRNEPVLMAQIRESVRNGRA